MYVSAFQFFFFFNPAFPERKCEVGVTKPHLSWRPVGEPAACGTFLRVSVCLSAGQKGDSRSECECSRSQCSSCSSDTKACTQLACYTPETVFCQCALKRGTRADRVEPFRERCLPAPRCLGLGAVAQTLQHVPALPDWALSPVEVRLCGLLHVNSGTCSSSDYSSGSIERAGCCFHQRIQSRRA